MQSLWLASKALQRFAAIRLVLSDRSKVELNSTLKATTATKCECEVDSSSDKSLWSPIKAIAMEVGLYGTIGSCSNYHDAAGNLL